MEQSKPVTVSRMTSVMIDSLNALKQHAHIDNLFVLLAVTRL